MHLLLPLVIAMLVSKLTKYPGPATKRQKGDHQGDKKLERFLHTWSVTLIIVARSPAMACMPS
jgi:hypothetical protein